MNVRMQAHSDHDMRVEVSLTVDEADRIATWILNAAEPEGNAAERDMIRLAAAIERLLAELT